VAVTFSLPGAFALATNCGSRRVARLPTTLLAALALGSAAPGFAQGALGSAFTYQGQLTESGQPANGLFDVQLCLFDSPGNPVALACAADFNDVPVEGGKFALAPDFGAAPFAGQQRFLELRVRPGASVGSYTILSPRQLVRATPEALRAAVAGAAPWGGLSGVPAGFGDGVDNDSGGTVTSVTAGTGLSGGNITGSGTIGIANGGVGATQLAAGAVGTAQINTAQVQARISGICAEGEYLRGINADGSVVCQPGDQAVHHRGRRRLACDRGQRRRRPGDQLSQRRPQGCQVRQRRLHRRGDHDHRGRGCSEFRHVDCCRRRRSAGHQPCR
jgi:hypothetical protein